MGTNFEDILVQGLPFGYWEATGGMKYTVLLLHELKIKT